ncbi:hypothetical protein EMIHUDRAFT_203718 [Emiliania huxleyi CCMP1516]|uniref:Uncharacterized protein n=2 Tax=Emiliania huxleyi TaxID=2903 RepID=A0A0D3K0A2_EMIH1|nr:hypothetical protein EMIHUDRAFT_203718 [Emiliania huxleyi CCMP1516]EOD29187.1 hypothetical protein EMIHUDRAFT_203718 [Emiliania huxleyi CCMP1516]|eukprot:XP_005781616.1 hypothetical protein EMIHUDRAFT_203718 [Emiliania huxleyi CCMP1516]
MDFRGDRQRLGFRGGLCELPHDILSHALSHVVVRGGCAAAGRLRQACSFFASRGGSLAMEQGCRSVVAARWGVSEWEAEGRRGRAATRPVLEVRDGAWRRGDWVLTAAYAVDLPLAVSRFVEARRRVQELPPGTADYEDKAVSLALLRADAAEARALLPEGFDVSPPERDYPSKDPIGTTGPALLTHHLLMALLPSEKAARCWDASCSLSEVLLHACTTCNSPTRHTARPTHLFVDFQMRVREMAETAAVVPPPPPLPAELRAALLEAPQGRERQREREAPLDAKFRSVQLGCRTLRLQAPADANGWQRLS